MSCKKRLFKIDVPFLVERFKITHLKIYCDVLTMREKANVDNWQNTLEQQFYLAELMEALLALKNKFSKLFYVTCGNGRGIEIFAAVAVNLTL